MTPSNKALDLIRSFEGCALSAYRDVGGVLTIGYGHTVGVARGATCDQQQADRWLVEDASFAALRVERAVTVPLTQCQLDALTSIAFNVGPGAAGVRDGVLCLFDGRPSTLLRKLNAGDYGGAADEFLRWNKVGGVEVAGLTRRRIAERLLFLGESV